MGIACRRWVTFHGLALNVATDLSYFARINPCGFESRVMTSLSRELARPVTVADVRPQLAAELARSLQRSAAAAPSAR
jgi:lipoate-protein ligase B